MDRKSIAEFTHKAVNFLSICDLNYKQWVFRYTFLELEKDLGVLGDITTQGIFPKNKPVKGSIVSREKGVLAGVEEIKYFLVDADSKFRPSIKGKFEINFKKKDGDVLKKGDVIMEISADVHDLLAVERTVLNLLMRMSGVAAYTKKIVDLVKDYSVLISPTRKTLWGLLDKKAVLIGGGVSHRINLSDAVLIKDNHLELMDRNYKKIFQNIAETKLESRFLEIEVETIEETLKVSEILSEFIKSKQLRTIGVVLMDNIKPTDITKAIKELKAKELYDNLLFEASGGINEENVVTYAKTGVDIVSMGSLTTGARSFDIGLDMLKE